MSSELPAPIWSRVPESTSWSIAAARACIWVVFSCARSTIMLTSAICSEMPVTASPILVDACAAEYCALIVSFWVRKASTFACSFCAVSSSFCSWSFICWICWSRPATCVWAS